MRAVAQLRAHGGTVARIGGSGGRPDPVEPGQPVRGVAPGQTMVLYGGAGVDAVSAGPEADQFVIAAGTIVRAG